MIQYSEGPLRISPDDFQATDGGITYGIKLRYLSALSCTIFAIAEKVDGDWMIVNIIDEDVDDGVKRAGGPSAYAETVIRPAVKTWLAERKLKPITPAHEVASLVGKWQSL